jgi:spermidine/putrescine ABC transporter ATP-binding subunit
MSVIRVERLCKRFGEVVALDRVDLCVDDGEFLTVLGPSGSGKTTMLLSIAGFETPSEGAILIDGHDVTHRPPHRRRVGLTFQSYALFPHMTVAENVGFPLRVRGCERDERSRRVGEALRLVRLEGFDDRRPHELSGGQQQRVALARAFVFEPDILLLDEPLAALDRQLRQTVQVELGELQRSLGVTTIAVTHDQEEALTMSDRILVLDEGRVQQHGPPEQVYRQPANRFVASFLGTANLFEGHLERNGVGDRVVWTANGAALPVEGRGAAAGAVVCAMVRPEQIRLAAPRHDAHGHAPCLPGRVRTAVYLGASTRYRVEVGAPSLVEVTEAGSARRFRPGEHVSLTWDPADTWLLPDTGAGGAGRARPQPMVKGET